MGPPAVNVPYALISSDRRDPTVNAYGPLYGNPEYSTDDMPILDPRTHKVTFHNAMIDRHGRVWLAATVRAPDNPDFCKKGSKHPSAKALPLERANRHLAILEPRTMKYTGRGGSETGRCRR